MHGHRGECGLPFAVLIVGGFVQADIAGDAQVLLEEMLVPAVGQLLEPGARRVIRQIGLVQGVGVAFFFRQIGHCLARTLFGQAEAVGHL